jgi:FkbM family methyltransferase
MFKKWFADDGDKTLRLNYPLTNDSLVFDLGGYKGDWANSIYQKYECNIFIFEPIPFLVEEMKVRFKDNEKIKIFPFALSDENKSMNIFLSNDGSSFNTNFSSESIECKVVSIKDFINENNINQVDLIKINIEGDEYNVLKNLLENNLISIFTDIQVQFHSFIDGAVNKREILQKLISETHDLTYNYDFVWENWKKK